MTTREYNPTGVTSRSATLSEADFSLSSQPRDVIIEEGTTTTGQDRDVSFEQEAGAVLDREFDVAANEQVPGTFSPYQTFESTDENILTVNQNGKVDRINDGTAGVIIRTRHLSRRVDLTVSRDSPAATETFLDYVPGSLARHAADAVDNRIIGLTANQSTKPIHDGSTYNASCWAYDLRSKLTCISREIPRATAVTPRHVVMAEHYQQSGSISFLAADGTVVDRTIIDKQNVGPSNDTDLYATDITVGLLDSDLPASITPCRIIPQGVETYLPTLSDWRHVPALCLDQEEKALVTDLASIDLSAYFNVPQDAQRLAFYEDKIGGDSGNPAFLIVNDELVLLTTWTFGGAGSGPDYDDAINAVNQTITDLDNANSVSSGYQLSQADLSGFTSY